MNKPRLMLLVASALLVIAGAAVLALLKRDAIPANTGDGRVPATPVDSPQGDALATATSAAASRGGDVVPGTEGAAVKMATAATTPSPANLPPMPPSDLPLRDQLDALVARANVGDGEAACRLVIEGERCDHMLSRRNFLKAVESGRVKGPAGVSDSDFAVEMAARVAESIAAMGDRCNELDIVKVPDVDESLAHAIGHLTVHQKVVLAMLRIDGSLARLRADGPTTMAPGRSSSEQLMPQFYSDYLVRFLDEGVAAGDVLAIEGKVMLHQPSSLPKEMFGLRVALPDQYRFALYALALQQLKGPDALGRTFSPVLDKVLKALSPSRRSQLDREVEKLVQTVRDKARQGSRDLGPAAVDAAELCAN